MGVIKYAAINMSTKRQTTTQSRISRNEALLPQLESSISMHRRSTIRTSTGGRHIRKTQSKATSGWNRLPALSSDMSTLCAKESRARFRNKLEKRKQESELQFGRPVGRRRSALNIEKLKKQEKEAKTSDILRSDDLNERKRVWKRKTPIEKFRTLLKRVILIIR